MFCLDVHVSLNCFYGISLFYKSHILILMCITRSRSWSARTCDMPSMHSFTEQENNLRSQFIIILKYTFFEQKVSLHCSVNYFLESTQSQHLTLKSNIHCTFDENLLHHANSKEKWCATCNIFINILIMCVCMLVFIYRRKKEHESNV